MMVKITMNTDVISRKLTEEEVQELLAQYAATRRTATRDTIVLQYASLVESVGRRFAGASEPLEDLVQEGYIGLINSVDKYDASKGVKFSTYATHFIIGQIKHHLRDKGKIIKEPAWLQELNQRVGKVVDSMSQDLGRQPTCSEVAEEMGLAEQCVADLLTTREVFKVGSIYGSREDGSGPSEADKLSDESVETFQLPVEDKVVLETALERLKDIERRVISAHFYRSLSQTEIAKRLDISCNYVSHILRNSTKKLRKMLTTEEIADSQMQRAHRLTRLESGHRRAEPSSVIDSLTGLYNREYFVDRLDEEVSRSCRHKDTLGVVVLEICLPLEVEDYVRKVRMEDLLYTIAQTMRRSVRKMDVMAHLEDSVFALILPHTGQHAETVCNRLTAAVNSMVIESGRRNEKFSPVLQTGSAVYPLQASGAAQLLDMAMGRLASATSQYLMGRAGESDPALTDDVDRAA